MPSAGCWMLDPPAVSSITVITDTFCTHNDAGIEQKMNIIVPIIISSHLPQSSQPSLGLTRLMAAGHNNNFGERERRQLVTRLHLYLYSGPGRFKPINYLRLYCPINNAVFLTNTCNIICIPRAPICLGHQWAFLPSWAPLRPKWYKLGRSGTPAPAHHSQTGD